jgi:hypothetical protein
MVDYHTVRPVEISLLFRDDNQVDIFPPLILTLGEWRQPKTYLTVRSVLPLPDGSATYTVSCKNVPLLSFLHDLYMKCETWTATNGKGRPLLKFLAVSGSEMVFPIHTDSTVRVWRCSSPFRVVPTEPKISVGDRLILAARLVGIVGVTTWSLAIETQDIMIME